MHPVSAVRMARRQPLDDGFQPAKFAGRQHVYDIQSISVGDTFAACYHLIRAYLLHRRNMTLWLAWSGGG